MCTVGLSIKNPTKKYVRKLTNFEYEAHRFTGNVILPKKIDKLIGHTYACNPLTHFDGRVWLEKNRETTLETAHPFTGNGNAGHEIASKNLGNCLQCASYQRKQKCCISTR